MKCEGVCYFKSLDHLLRTEFSIKMAKDHDRHIPSPFSMLYRAPMNLQTKNSTDL
jgi:hypothetical protein